MEKKFLYLLNSPTTRGGNCVDDEEKVGKTDTSTFLTEREKAL